MEPETSTERSQCLARASKQKQRLRKGSSNDDEASTMAEKRSVLLAKKRRAIKDVRMAEATHERSRRLTSSNTSHSRHALPFCLTSSVLANLVLTHAHCASALSHETTCDNVIIQLWEDVLDLISLILLTCSIYPKCN